MISQRILAALLTALFFAVIIVAALYIARALGHPAYGWFIGIGFCVIMVVAFLHSRRQH